MAKYSSSCFSSYFYNAVCKSIVRRAFILTTRNLLLLQLYYWCHETWSFELLTIQNTIFTYVQRMFVALTCNSVHTMCAFKSLVWCLHFYVQLYTSVVFFFKSIAINLIWNRKFVKYAQNIIVNLLAVVSHFQSWMAQSQNATRYSISRLIYTFHYLDIFIRRIMNYEFIKCHFPMNYCKFIAQTLHFSFEFRSTIHWSFIMKREKLWICMWKKNLKIGRSFNLFKC